MRTDVSIRRRRLLKAAGGAVTGALAAAVGRPACADPLRDEASAFEARSCAAAFAALGGVPEVSTHITLDLPQVAEDGALVPVTVSSRLPGTREILIVVDGNPQPLAACFTLPEGTEPYVATRIRLAQNARVYAAVRTDQGLYAAARSIQVIAGGCG